MQWRGSNAARDVSMKTWVRFVVWLNGGRMTKRQKKLLWKKIQKDLGPTQVPIRTDAARPDDHNDTGGSG